MLARSAELRSDRKAVHRSARSQLLRGLARAIARQMALALISAHNARCGNPLHQGPGASTKGGKCRFYPIFAS